MYPQNHQYRYQAHSSGQESPCYYMDQSNVSLKTDRRVWNKSACDINLEYPDQEKMAANLKRYDDYLFNLQINNRIQKIANQKDEKREKLEKLEAGFNVYVNGAHQKAERYTPRYTLTKSSSTSTSNEPKKMLIPRRVGSRKLEIENLEQFDLLVSNRKATMNSKKSSGRKKWTRSSFILKTDEGYEIKINAPKPTRDVKSADVCVKKKNHSNDYYSDDFETDSDLEQSSSTNMTNERSFDKNLIESVQFSNDSSSSAESVDDEEIENNDSKKKFVFNLNKTDIKNLRDSLSLLNLDSDNTAPFKVGEFKNNFETKEEPISEVDEPEDTIKDKSSICDMIIQKVSHLDPKERHNLLHFLKKIDDKNKNDS